MWKTRYGNGYALVKKIVYVLRSVDPSPSRNSARDAVGGATGSGPATKFVSTAEMMQRFQNGTPGNFFLFSTLCQRQFVSTE